MDLYSPNPEMHINVAKAVGKRREKFIYQAHLCTKWENNQYSATRKLEEVKANFSLMLKNLNTDYIDIGMIHYIDSMKTWDDVVNNGILEYAKELKKNGIIKSLGVSSHNPEVALEIIKQGDVEVVMFSVNPCYDLLPGNEDCDNLFSKESYENEFINFDPKRIEFYEEAAKLNIGITAMKVFAGGELLSENSPALVAMSVNECIHYALTRPQVATALVGCRTLDELKKSIDYTNASAEEKDYSETFKKFPKINWEGVCMYCGHCAPCPNGIDVAMVTKLYNLTKAQNEIAETVREHYAALPSHASDCVKCRACEKRCPFNVKIVENINSAKKTFGY